MATQAASTCPTLSGGVRKGCSISFRLVHTHQHVYCKRSVDRLGLARKSSMCVLSGAAFPKMCIYNTTCKACFPEMPYHVAATAHLTTIPVHSRKVWRLACTKPGSEQLQQARHIRLFIAFLLCSHSASSPVRQLLVCGGHLKSGGAKELRSLSRAKPPWSAFSAHLSYCLEDWNSAVDTDRASDIVF